MMRRMIEQLPNLIGGNQIEVDGDGTARRLRLALLASVGTIVAAGLYGLAAGCTSPELAVGNLMKVPMVVVMSGVAALPAGLLAAKLTDADIGLTDVVTSLVSANFTGSLVLLAAAPIVALYYLTGSTFSAHVGLTAGLLAEAVAVWIFFRAANERRPEDSRKRDVILPLAVTSLIQIVALVQLVGIASPILPEVTPLTQGMDGLFALQ